MTKGLEVSGDISMQAEFATYVSGLERPPPATIAPEVSVVVPVYFNAESLVELYRRIDEALRSIAVEGWNITFVDDGSGDASRHVLNELVTTHPNVRVVHLARNFGSFDAITAGLGCAEGRCVAVISADLQDPPEKLAEMVKVWRRGKKLVLATRVSREDPWTSRIFSFLFYRVFRLLVTPEMPPGGFDFFVLDAQIARLLSMHGEKNTMMPAALLYFGFDREIIPYHRAARPHGTSRWTFWRKFKLMYDAVLSNSYVPLRIMTAIGAAGVSIAVLYLLVVFVHRLSHDDLPLGWASLMTVALFFHGLILMSVGIVGEYVWRTFDAARKRPQYVIDRWIQSKQLTSPRPEPLRDDVASNSSLR
ncbi:MAG: glycosyltransferase family 2 protein [Myxococcales bacterium]|nr:glycosyltransferase family 2 protein [Myxococcales bacterium]